MAVEVVRPRPRIQGRNRRKLLSVCALSLSPPPPLCSMLLRCSYHVDVHSNIGSWPTQPGQVRIAFLAFTSVRACASLCCFAVRIPVLLRCLCNCLVCVFVALRITCQWVVLTRGDLAACACVVCRMLYVLSCMPDTHRIRAACCNRRTMLCVWHARAVRSAATRG